MEPTPSRSRKTYRKYLWDPTAPIPRTTLLRHRKRAVDCVDNSDLESKKDSYRVLHAYIIIYRLYIYIYIRCSIMTKKPSDTTVPDVHTRRRLLPPSHTTFPNSVTRSPAPSDPPTDSPPDSVSHSPAPSDPPTDSPPDSVSHSPAPSDPPTDSVSHSPAPSDPPTDSPPDSVSHSPAPSDPPTDSPPDSVSHSPAPSDPPTDSPPDSVSHSPAPSDPPTDSPPDSVSHSPAPSDPPTDSGSHNPSEFTCRPDPLSDPHLFSPLYPGASISLCAAMCAIMQFCIANKLSFTAIGELLKLLAVLLPSLNLLPRTFYKFRNFFQKFNPIHSHIQVCTKCQRSTDDTCSCDDRTTENKAHIVHLEVQKPLEKILSGKLI